MPNTKSSHCGDYSSPGRDSYPVPSSGAMADKFGLGIRDLAQKLKAFEADVAYVYVIDTIEWDKAGFVQKGSAPNLQGAAVTLCTCKHWMRTFRSKDDWKGAWVAGFCDVKAGHGEHSLVYLMRIGEACGSHQELWKTLSPASQRGKSVRVNRLGDVYQPKTNLGDVFSPSSYYPPVEGHSHHRDVHDQCWHKDIDYKKNKRRRPSLLVGCPDQTYLWNRPTVRYVDAEHPLGRGQKKMSIHQLLGRLTS